MTIASALTALNQDITSARTAITNKGGTVTSGGGSSQLATDIATIPTGSSPVISSLSITPTTSQQTITAPSGTDGYSPITVNAVTSSIDANITANNIVSGVSILGVSGSATVLNGDTLSVTPTTSAQTLAPTSPKNGFTQVSVSAVTSSIDSNITAENIKDGVTILGVTGTYEGSGGGGSKYGANVNTFLGDLNTNGVLQKPTEQSQLIFTGVTDVALEALYFKFYKTKITSVSFPNLTTASGYYGIRSAFSDTSLTSVSFPELTTVSGNYVMEYAFLNCTSLTSVSFPKLTTISGEYGMEYIFKGCSSLATVSFPKLTTISGQYGLRSAFESCAGLTSISFPKLTTINTRSLYTAFYGSQGFASISFPELTTMSGTYGIANAFQNSRVVTVRFPKLTTMGANSFYNTFYACTKIKDIYFNKVTTSTFSTTKNQISNMFGGTTAASSGTVNVHFPSNLSSTVSGLSGYPTFGGNSSKVVLKFDLTATS